jgi:cysteine synthase A
MVDDVVLVKDEDAFRTIMHLGQGYGYCVGVSSGANMHIAKDIAKELKPYMKVVTVLPDSGQRYLDHIR